MVDARHVRTHLLLLLLGTLAGCAGAPSHHPENVNLSGFPPAYRQGYRDGCDSARSWGGLTRDNARFKNDRQYAQGWRDGHDICGKR